MTALDTNVLVYACDTADPAKQQRALQIIEDTRDGVLLWQVACEFLAASRKLVAQGFTPGQAWARPNRLSRALSSGPAQCRTPKPRPRAARQQKSVLLGRDDYWRLSGGSSPCSFSVSICCAAR